MPGDPNRTVSDTQPDRVGIRSELFDALPDPVLVVDPAGSFVDVNPAALALLGYSREQILGMRVDDLGAEGAEVSRRRLEQLIRGGFWRGSLQLKRADGTSVRVFLTASIVEMEDGPRYVAVLRHTAEVDVLEELALAAETRLMVVVDSVVDAIITVDHEERIQVFNASAEQVFRCPAADAIGRPIDRFIPERFRKAHHQDVRRFTETGTTTRTMGHLGTVYGLRADGEEFPMEATISKVDVGGHPILTVIARDVSERLPAQERTRLESDIESLQGQADRFGDLFRALDTVTDAVLRHLVLDDLLDDFLERLLTVLDARSAVVLLLDATRDVLVRRASMGLEREFTDEVEVPVGRGLDGTVAQTKQPLLIGDTSTHEVINPTIKEYLHSLVVVPLLIEDRLIGVLHVGSVQTDAFSETDVRFVSVVAARLAVSIENARLHEALEQAYGAEHRARLNAEQAVEWMRRLQGMTTALASAATLAEVNHVVISRSMDAIGAVAAAVMMRQGDVLLLAASDGYPEDALGRWSQVPLDAPLPAAETVRTGRALWLSMRAAVREEFPAATQMLDQLGFEALISLPLVVADHTIGAFVLHFVGEKTFEADEVALLHAIAQQYAQAHERLRLLDLERSVSARARRLIEANVVGVMVGGEDGTIVDANDAVLTMLGYERQDLEDGALNWRDLTPPEHLARSADALREAAERGGSAPYEKEYLRKDGHRLPVLVGLALVDRDPFQAIAYVVDLSERDAAEREREHLLEQERLARDAAEAANERLAFLSEASQVLSSSLDYLTTLRSIARAAVPRLADWCAVDLLSSDGALDRLAVEHVDPTKKEFAWELSRRFPVRLDDPSPSGTAHVLRTNAPELTEEIPRAMIEAAVEAMPDVREAILALELRSSIIVPLSNGAEVLGAMTFVTAESGRHYGQTDLVLAQELARRASIAIVNARLYDGERTARQEAEISTGRLRLLADLDAALLAALDLEEAADALVRFLAARIGDYAVAHLVGRDGQIGHVAAAHADARQQDALLDVVAIGIPDLEDPDSLVAATLRSGRSELIAAITENHLARLTTSGQLEGWRAIGCASSVLVPIRLRDRILGTITICRAPGSPILTEDDLGFLSDMAERAAPALDNARLYGERTYVADTLQRSLLPPSLPEIPAVAIGVAYRPAGDGTQVGGDFYDVFETADDEWAISIGDVCGKGSGAAAIMALSRYTIRTAALHQSRPSAILKILNEALLRQTAESRFCTACHVRLRRSAEGVRLTLSCGGHPLPLILRSDGALETAGAPGTLLGCFADPTLFDQAVDLDPGDTLVLYTDGLTDERRGGEEFGEGRLGELLKGCRGASADEIVTRLMSGVLGFREGDPQDDIAILAVQVAGN
ncbi:MAG: SpoIIE family protein phosphatase [Actinomycetota bacterium]